jgi:hypothetical protein
MWISKKKLVDLLSLARNEHFTEATRRESDENFQNARLEYLERTVKELQAALRDRAVNKPKPITPEPRRSPHDEHQHRATKHECKCGKHNG